MTKPQRFPARVPGTFYLAEGGTETEAMYRHGHALREFAMFELLNDPNAASDLRGMYRRFLDVVARNGTSAIVAGFDYRASPDWGAKLGYAPEGLAEMQHKCIDFLRDVSAPYTQEIDQIVICGCVGPRGDAYQLNKTITADEAQDYHMVQLETLKACDVDYVWAATINNVPEAVGLSRAASDVGLPICVSFTLTSEHRLRSGVSLQQAVEMTDAETADKRPDSYGINCSHPIEFMPALTPGNWTDRLRSLRPNAAQMDKVALCKLGHIEEGDPVELGKMMGDLARRYPGVDIFGGCCGSWDRHIDEIAMQVSRARSAPA